MHHNHIQQLRTKLEEALNALHLPIGTYAHAGPNTNDPVYAIDFQELRTKIKDAWTSLASASITQSYDGDGLRVKKTEYGYATYYIRSSVLGGQVLAELDNSGNWSRGYVYAGSTMMAVQQGGAVWWMHEDPVTKSKRTTDINGNVVSAIETDPWGADTNRSSNGAFQPKKYTSYDRDGNGSDEAMFRRYNRQNSRFDQPDPYDGSYDLASPQSLNRYAYTGNDPVNFVDPSGLSEHPYPTLPRPPGPPTYVVTVTAPPSPASTSGFAGSVLGGDENFLLEQPGGEPGVTDPTGGGPGPQLPQKMARCLALAKRILGSLNEIKRLEKNYDPGKDFFGGYPIRKRLPSGQVIDLGNSKPGGHYKGMMQQQESLRNNWEAFKRECIDDDSNDFRPPPVPADARQYAYKKWTPPYNPGGTPRTFWDNLRDFFPPPPGQREMGRQGCWWCLPLPPWSPVWN